MLSASIHLIFHQIYFLCFPGDGGGDYISLSNYQVWLPTGIVLLIYSLRHLQSYELIRDVDQLVDLIASHQDLVQWLASILYNLASILYNLVPFPEPLSILLHLGYPFDASDDIY